MAWRELGQQVEAPPAGSGEGQAGWLCRHGCPGPGWVGRARLLPEIPSYGDKASTSIEVQKFFRPALPPHLRALHCVSVLVSSQPLPGTPP